MLSDPQIQPCTKTYIDTHTKGFVKELVCDDTTPQQGDNTGDLHKTLKTSLHKVTNNTKTTCTTMCSALLKM